MPHRVVAQVLLLAGIASSQQWLPLDGPVQPGRGIAFDTARRRMVAFGIDGVTWEIDNGRPLPRASSNVPFPRTQHSMVYDPLRRYVLLYGGRTQGGSDLGDTWLWDGTEWRFDLSATPPPRRAGAALGFDDVRGRVVLFGGLTGGAFRNDLWEHDGNHWQQRLPAAPVPPVLRPNPCLACDPDRGVTVLLGVNTSGLTVTWEWNGTSWRNAGSGSPPFQTWTNLAYDAVASGVTALVSVPGGQQVWRWDGTAWSMTGVITLPRSAPCHWFDPARGQLVVYGGVENGIVRSDAWTWDGTALHQLWPEPKPRERRDFAAVRDSARNRVVWFGGFTDQDENDTWEWDGCRWLRRQPLLSPVQRHAAAACFDPVSSVTVLFGGRCFGVDLGDTWTWDGSNWTQHVRSRVPAGRNGAAMAWDPLRGRALLFGGYGVGAGWFADTWEWDGNVWTQAQPASPPPARSGHALCHDPVRGRMLLFGGLGPQGSGSTFRNDTWEWNGSEWQQLVPAASPPVLETPSLTFDPIAQRPLLGGFTLSTPRVWQLWEFDGATWLQRLPPLQAPALTPRLLTDSAAGTVQQIDSRQVRELSLHPAGVASFGTGCGAPAPVLACRTRPRRGDPDFGMELLAEPSQLVLFALAAAAASTPIGNGCTVLLQDPVLFLQSAGGVGMAFQPIALPSDQRLRGLTVVAQAAVLAQGGLQLSQGLRITLGD